MNPEFVKEVAQLSPFWTQLRLAGPVGWLGWEIALGVAKPHMGVRYQNLIENRDLYFRNEKLLVCIGKTPGSNYNIRWEVKGQNSIFPHHIVFRTKWEPRRILCAKGGKWERYHNLVEMFSPSAGWQNATDEHPPFTPSSQEFIQKFPLEIREFLSPFVKLFTWTPCS